jgi:type IV secretory pathway VirB2 component (pilin)
MEPLVASLLMGGRAAVVMYVVALAVVVVGADVVFFRHHFWPRLMVNVGIVLIFGAFYFRFQSAFTGK